MKDYKCKMEAICSFLDSIDIKNGAATVVTAP